MNVTFPVGSTDDAMECLNLTIIDDSDALEGELTFNVTLTESDEAVMVGNSIQVITITDDEGI